MWTSSILGVYQSEGYFYFIFEGDGPIKEVHCQKKNKMS
jgi:hypothetical protein